MLDHVPIHNTKCYVHTHTFYDREKGFCAKKGECDMYGCASQHAHTFFSGWHRVVDAGGRDAQVVVQREPLAVQHLRPREAERGHHGRAAALDALAQGPARLYGLVQVVQAHGREQGAQELPGVRVTLLLHQRDPGRGLLQNLAHGLVSEQVGQAHLRVLDVVAQEQVGGDRLAVVLLVEQLVLAEIV